MDKAHTILMAAAVVAISLALFVFVSVLTRKENARNFKEIAKIPRWIVAQIRYLPARYRLWRDPELKCIAKCIWAYHRLIVELQMSRDFQKAFESSPDEEQQRVCRSVGRSVSDISRMIVDDLFNKRTLVATFLANLSDEDIVILAAEISTHFAAPPPLPEIRNFLRDERDLAREIPYMVVGHMDRLKSRFPPPADSPANE